MARDWNGLNSLEGLRRSGNRPHQSRQAKPCKSWIKTKTFLALIVVLAGWYAFSALTADPRETLRANPAIAVTLEPLQTVQLDTLSASIAIPENWRPMTRAELQSVDDTFATSAQDEDLTGFMSDTTFETSDFTLSVSRDSEPLASSEESARVVETVFAGIGWLSAVTGTKVDILQSAAPIDQHGKPGAQISIWTQDNGRQDITHMRFVDTADGQLVVMLMWRAGRCGWCGDERYS